MVSLIDQPVVVSEEDKCILRSFSCKSEHVRRAIPIPGEEDPGSLRSPYTRDRDRIVFSKPFRRLAHKTQVYLASQGSDHMRTRLTHTLEVTQIARIIARALNMNEDLVEAMALGHDVGHAPFGHAGERQLCEFLQGREALPSRIAKQMRHNNPLMQKSDFKHSFQSVRLLTEIDEYYPDEQGINISFQCLEGILKHTGVTLDDDDELKGKPERLYRYYEVVNLFDEMKLQFDHPSTVEGQIVAIADEIAQVSHDLNDALDLRIVPIKEYLLQPEFEHIALDIRRRYFASAVICDTYPLFIDDSGYKPSSTQFLATIIRRLTTNTIVELCRKLLFLSKQIDLSGQPVVLPYWILSSKGNVPGDEFKGLKKYKDDFVINNYDVNRMDNKGKYIIRQLLDSYLSDPRQLPDKQLEWYLRIKKCRSAGITEKQMIAGIRRTQQDHQITGHFDDSEIIAVNKALLLHNEGEVFRKINSKLLEKFIPYIAIDIDYRRTVVDYIACMTDSYAEREVSALYN